MEIKKFYFCGDGCGRCDNKEPHPPHQTGEYGHNNQDDFYCLGKEGNTQDGYLNIEIMKSKRGTPVYPSEDKGFYYYSSGIPSFGERFYARTEYSPDIFDDRE